jgi:small subunit ribosomal protein S16
VAVKLRLMRVGKKKQPTYRVVAADARSPRDGRFIEIVGIYDPRPDPSAIRIDNDKAVGWLRQGAQPTESVRKLLEISGAWEEFSGKPPTRPKADAPAPSKAEAKAEAKKAKAEG